VKLATRQALNTFPRCYKVQEVAILVVRLFMIYGIHLGLCEHKEHPNVDQWVCSFRTPKEKQRPQLQLPERCI
jgi:hypothetical protein